MASEIRANKQTNRVGLGTVTYTDTGIIVSGIVTANSLGGIGHIDVGSNIKLGNAGVITATSFIGSGAALTGIDATAIKDSAGNVKIQAQASGAVYTGIHTFSSAIDIGSNIFEYGQTYVALSRVKSLEGLYLTKVNTQKIKAHPKVISFYKQFKKEINR